jgi:hypothetical protein
MVSGLMVLSMIAFTLIKFSNVTEGDEEDSEGSIKSGSSYAPLLEDEYDEQMIEKPLVHRIFWILLVQFGINFVENGILPSLTTYAFLPYHDGKRILSTVPFVVNKQDIMSLAINISLIADPIACLVGSFVQFYNLWLLSSIWASLAAYFVLIAKLSPHPLFISLAGGGYITMLAFIAMRVSFIHYNCLPC